MIVADRHIWHADSAFGALPGFRVDLRLVEHDGITNRLVRDADILLVRSSTRVDGALLDGSRVRFVATATIGDDHIDRALLAARGIAFASAAGSSTGSVVEYMTAALLHLEHHHGVRLDGAVLGVVGVGRIGTQVARRAEGLGMRVLANDPPRALRGDDGFDWQPLPVLLEQADLLTLHTPLVRDGAHPTLHLIDEAALARFSGRVVLNAARGAVVDNAALLGWLEQDDTRLAVLDCWEGEPAVSRALLAHPQVVVATPHIAGHSLDGKAANTQFVYDALCRFLGIEGGWRMERELPPVAPIPWRCGGGDARAELACMVERLYPIGRDVDACRDLLRLEEPEAFARGFIRLRRHYPVRRAWHLQRLVAPDANSRLRRLATAAGLVLEREG